MGRTVWVAAVVGLLVGGMVGFSNTRQADEGEAEYERLTHAAAKGHGISRFYDNEEGTVCYVYEGRRGSTIECMVSAHGERYEGTGKPSGSPGALSL